MVDREGLLEHLRALDEALRDWERYREKVSLRDLRSDRDARNMVLHAMLVAIQSAIDIASHLIAEHRLRRPETYRETFEILADAGILPRDLGEELADLAGF
ncbi:MAG: HepT-like ribonuclease domain-containing protein, partial [candidate division NC10 bacterium]